MGNRWSLYLTLERTQIHAFTSDANFNFILLGHVHHEI
jgi:hypothetical protein